MGKDTRKIFIDCPQEIPCNPCCFSCPTGAIHIDGELTSRPSFEVEKCIGCGNCVAACPGQACFLMDEQYSETQGTIDFPYEYLPIPQPGEVVDAMDNMGNLICKGEIVEVLSRKSWANTLVIRMAVPKEKLYEVRGMKRKK